MTISFKSPKFATFFPPALQFHKTMKIFLDDNLKICPSISDPSRRKSVEPEKGSFRNQNQRTRSASRERNLVKIKFCWRCHQTGHESFDCTAELQPANWCPRCLESSHWEDSCWVNEQEVRKICVKKCQAKFLVGLV